MRSLHIVYSLDSYVYVNVDDNTGEYIEWLTANGWTLLNGYQEANGSNETVYYMLLKTVRYGDSDLTWTEDTTGSGYTYYYEDSSTGLTYYYDDTDSSGTAGTYTVVNDEGEVYTYTCEEKMDEGVVTTYLYTASIHILDEDTVSYSASIENGTLGDIGKTYSLNLSGYIIQAWLEGTDPYGESIYTDPYVAYMTVSSEATVTNVTTGAQTVTESSLLSGTTVTNSDGSTTTTYETATAINIVSADSNATATAGTGVTIDESAAKVSTESGVTTYTLTLSIMELDDYTYAAGASYMDHIAVVGQQSGSVVDISVIGVAETNTEVFEITYQLEKGLQTVSVYHEGTAMSELTEAATGTYEDQTYYYDSDTGVLYIYTSKFSEFAIITSADKIAAMTASGTVYETMDEAVEDGNIAAIYDEATGVYTVYENLTSAIKASSAGDTVELNADITENVTISKSITLDLGGNTLTGSTSASSSVLSADLRGAVTIGAVTATITNGTITGDMNGIWCNSSSFDLTLDGVTISNNSYYGLYINSSSTATQTMTITGSTVISGNKRGIYGQSLTVTMESGEISDNTSTGVWVKSFTMNGGTISNNSGTSGAAVYGGTFVMNGGTISGNTVTSNGGAVYGSDVTINGGTITGTTGGSGIYMNGGTLTINGGTISNNAGKTYGGGVYCGNKCTFVMTGGTITGNSSTYSGTGIYFDSQNISATISGGSILNNNVVKNGTTTENSNNMKVGSMKPVISGGTFSFSVSSYLADGYTQTTNNDGTYTVSAGN